MLHQTDSEWDIERFTVALRERNVCPIAVASNAAAYFYELIEAQVSIEAYLSKVDTRTHGGLLHAEAIEQLQIEATLLQSHPWAALS